jgi:MYXO-CTERM domain-containing protein
MRKDAQKIIDETTCHLRLVVPSDWSEYQDKIAIVGADEKETPIVVERWNVDTPFTPGNYQLKLEHTHSWISHATSRPLPLPEGTALAAFNCLGDAKSPTVLDVAALFKDNLDPPEKHDVAAATAAPAVAPASDKPVGSSVPVTETPPGCQCRSGRAGGTEASYRGLVALALSLSAFFRRRRPRPAAPMAESRPSERSRIDDGP